MRLRIRTRQAVPSKMISFMAMTEAKVTLIQTEAPIGMVLIAVMVTSIRMGVLIGTELTALMLIDIRTVAAIGMVLMEVMAIGIPTAVAIGTEPMEVMVTFTPTAVDITSMMMEREWTLILTMRMKMKTILLPTVAQVPIRCIEQHLQYMRQHVRRVLRRIRVRVTKRPLLLQLFSGLSPSLFRLS